MASETLRSLVDEKLPSYIWRRKLPRHNEVERGETSELQIASKLAWETSELQIASKLVWKTCELHLARVDVENGSMNYITQWGPNLSKHPLP